MELNDVVKTAFRDELGKIAGEMQGFTRIGRKPISVEKMISNENELTGLPEDFAKVASRAGKALLKMAWKTPKTLTAVGLGAGGALLARQANEDRKLGRALRRQQQAQQQ